MAPCTYKLTYFNLKALGEPIRYLLKYGGLEFEDVRVEFPDWPALKPTIAFGQLPLLEIDGRKLNQSTAICRFLGKQLKLAGTSDLEALEIDSIVDSFVDLKTKISIYSKETNEVIKAEKEMILNNATLPYYFGKFEKLIEENKGYLACGKLTWADFFVAGLMDYINYMLGEDVTEKYPKLKGMVDYINDLPAIKKWIFLRPKTDF